MKKIIDFHTHILPGIDDGSKDIETSRLMLEIEKNTGIDAVVLTPHFYAWLDPIEDFLDSREKAYLRIKPFVEIETLLGAEVAFFNGISKAKAIDKLCINETNVILIEMPFGTWTKEQVQEVLNMSENGKMVIIAHINRYIDDKKNYRFLKEMANAGIIMQLNTECALNDGYIKMTRIMLKRTKAILDITHRILLGSDCHGVEHRGPNMQEGRAKFAEVFGRKALRMIDAFSEEFFKEIS